MQIPEKIKLGGHIIKIEFADTAHIDDRGEFRNYHNLIRLEREQDTPEDNVAECFLHEIMEAIVRKNNLKIDHTHLTVLSEMLFAVIRENNLDFRKDA